MAEGAARSRGPTHRSDKCFPSASVWTPLPGTYTEPGDAGLESAGCTSGPGATPPCSATKQGRDLRGPPVPVFRAPAARKGAELSPAAPTAAGARGCPDVGPPQPGACSARPTLPTPPHLAPGALTLGPLAASSYCAGTRAVRPPRLRLPLGLWQGPPRCRPPAPGHRPPPLPDFTSLVD